MKHSNQKKWIFIPVENNNNEKNNNTYYIVNGQYIEFLCASDDHLEITKSMRRINENLLFRNFLKFISNFF